LRTLGSPFLALLLQEQGGGLPAAAAEASGPPSPSLVGILADSSAVNLFVLLTLAVLSIVCWAIILHKSWMFRRARRQTSSFLDVFRRSNKFSEVQAVCRSLGESPLVGLFQAGYAELSAQLRQGGQTDLGDGPPAHPRPPAGRPILKSLPAVDRALMRASVVEVNKLERRVPFLATVASIAPFVGLFGTVWGIMMSFLSIGAEGSTNITVVAPGIAEALIATAAGLAAAIPAVIAYNHFSSKIRLLAAEMDDFAMEFLNIAERNFT
jgi:biopolymer transport protein TolQ